MTADITVILQLLQRQMVPPAYSAVSLAPPTPVAPPTPLHSSTAPPVLVMPSLQPGKTSSTEQSTDSHFMDHLSVTLPSGGEAEVLQRRPSLPSAPNASADSAEIHKHLSDPVLPAS